VAIIARQLGMHERTLNRRLQEEGTTFRRELENVRYELARQLLADTIVPLSKIAAALNYADATAFARAFKRWSGIPPAEWRQLSRKRQIGASASPAEVGQIPGPENS
jgi:AraC-like DNA-binding protein